MHVRLLASYLDKRAGSAVYMRALAERLAAAGHRVSVICLGPEEIPPPEGVVPEDFAILAPRHLRMPGLWRFDHLASFLRSRRRLVHLGWPRPDAVIASEHSLIRAHADLFPASPWTYLPHAPVEVADEMARYFADPLARAVNRRLYARAQKHALIHADAVVRFSRHALDAMLSAFPGIRPKRAVVIPPAVDLPAEWSPPRAASPVRLLHVGRLVPDKNVALLIEMLSHVDPEKDFHLDIVGDGPQRERLEGLARAMGMEKRITFHGAVDDVSPHYARADLVVMPSRRESLGLVQIEAMAHGRPVLAFDPAAPGMELLGGRIVDHGVTGWLARDEEDFLRILHLLIWNPAPLRPAGRAARRVAEERFSWESHITRWENLLHELVKAAPST
ncbi:MAG: glycosyltransferase family 1 protein [Alphaproteobacteria bacterium]|nr:MAG: glycosyltransferase family 1 protein [Alphaproteobacteria bacterium]